MKRKLLLLLCALLATVGTWAGDVQRDVTSYYLTNTTFDSNLNGWTNDKMEWMSGNAKFDTGFAQVWSTGTVRTASIKQSITNLPAGRYKLTAKCVGGYQNEPVTLDADYLYATPNGQSTTKADVIWYSGDLAKERELQFVNDAVQNVEIGFFANGTKWWSAIDDVKLFALDIAAASYELPTSAVTIDTWYRFTTESGGDAYTLSSTGDATITWTTEGTLTNDDGITNTWSLTSKQNVLLAPSTTYYIKSSAAVTLTPGKSSVNSSYVSGWEKVTSISQLQTNPEDYFFAIFSANNTGLYLINRNEANNEKLRYVTAGDPLRNGASLFEVENFDGDFVLKSAVNGKYFENRPVDGQDRPGIGEQDGPWNYHADLTEKDENCRTTLSFHDGVCTIQDKNDHNGNRYIGLWYVDHDYANNEILAGNKSEAEKASFIIYRIPKEKCDLTYLIQDADCKSNDHWDGGSDGGRTFNEMVAFDGETRNVFSANNSYATASKNGQRHQAITLPATGAYKLTTFCKVPGTNNNGYAQIWVDDLGNNIDYTNARHLYTVDTDGNKTSDINTDGSGWFANEIYFTANAGDSKTIYINLSPGDMSTSGRYELAYVSGMKLTYLGTAPEISFDEAVVNPVVEANLAHADVTIKRNMKSDRWNTFTVPFSMAIPGGWTVKELTGVDYNESTSNYSLNFEEASSIVAGKAYMVKPGSDITEVNADDVTINTTTAISSKVSDGDYTANFVGNNSYLTAVPKGSSYIISNNVFYAVDTDNIIQKGFRAYITVGGPSPSSARSTVSYDTEGGVTDIQNVVVKGLDESVAQKDGKYFENNKIVIVKNGIKYGSNGQKLN